MQVSFWQIIILGLLQGITELFPISSLGHSVIIPPFLGMGNIEFDDNFLPMLTALHLGTALALLLYFRRDWIQLFSSLANALKEGEVRRGSDEWVSWLILVGSIPAGLIGVLLANNIKTLFSSPLIVAGVLIVNGLVLLGGEGLRRRAERNLREIPPAEREAYFRPLKALSWKEALMIGLAQSLALIPGFSRSGMTIVAGLGLNMTHEDAARFSFLLGTPIILGASLVELPSLTSESPEAMLLVLLGMVLAAVAAFLSAKWLLRYFRTGRLDPFGYYCILIGASALGLFLALHVGF